MDDSIATITQLAAEALDLLIGAAEQIWPDGWDRPSNLEDWSLRELVAHATGSTAKIIALIDGGEVAPNPSSPADWSSDDPLGRLRELAAQLHEAAAGANLEAQRPSPQGVVPLRQALAFPVADLALHSWDIHRSHGRLVELPLNLLTMCTSLVESVPEAALRRPEGFGSAQPAPDDATPTARLMAYLGRKV